MKVRKSIIWGSLFILAAVALVVNKLGYLQGMGFWNILFSAVLAGIFIEGILKRRWGSILFSAAFFIIVNDSFLHMESLTPWTVLGVAFLGTIGLNMLFPAKNRHIRNHLFKEDMSGVEFGESYELMVTDEGEAVQQDVIFGSSVKYIKSQELSRVNADCIFGEISIYLTEAVLKEHQAKISVDVIFGNANIYVPACWAVSANIGTIFGHTSACGTCDPNGEEKLIINGDVIFGEVVIHYV